MEVKKKVKEETSRSMKEKMSCYSTESAARQPSIYRVHNYYCQDINDKVYEPTVVAVGPYHRGKKGLKMMEEHKLRYLNSLLRRENDDVDTYISAIAEIEEEAHSYYADLSQISAVEFIEMLVLDGCFLIELVRKFQSRDPACATDPVFQMEWVLEIMRRDLILFENQIPFFVLCKLFDLIHHEPNQYDKLIDWFCLFLGMEELYGSEGMQGKKPEDVKHLLDLMHTTLRPPYRIFTDLNACPLEREFRLIPSATELKDSNVKFRSTDVGAVWELRFSNGVLTMSPLVIQDGTEHLLRNLVVYEQYFPGNQPTYVTDYALVLECLIKTARDVEILCECGVVVNTAGDNHAAAAIVGRLSRSVLHSESYFIYSDMCNRINGHYKRRWNRARAALNRDYFNTPWAYISFIAALLLLLLTLVQTVFSALQVL